MYEYEIGIVVVLWHCEWKVMGLFLLILA